MQKVASELIGTALLLCAVIGSGIMAVNLAQGNDAIALLANTLATVCALYVLIEIFGPVSGAHFNPVVTVTLVLLKREDRRNFLPYAVAQLAGAFVGACLANAMFGLDVVQLSLKARDGAGTWLGEVVATCGLIMVILLGKPERASSLVAAFIGAAYWFTSSTSFANPAAVFGRMFSNTFAGIAPASAPLFVLAQCLGAVLALGLVCGLRGREHAA